MDEVRSQSTPGIAGRNTAPVPPFLIVFNAAESFDAYRLVMKSKVRFVTLMSFPSATFPCTIGVVLDDWNELARNIYKRSRGYILSRAGKYLAGTSGDPLAEMLAAGETTLNNPFDPMTIDRFAQNDGWSLGENAALDRGVVLAFDGEEFVCVGPAELAFSNLPYPKHTQDIHRNPDFARIVDLACLNAAAEIFLEGGWKFAEAPDFVRRSAGVIKSSTYTDFEEFVSRLMLPLREVAQKFVCTDTHAYEDIVRLARGVAISVEIENVPIALERWQQLLGAEQLETTQKVRQFELEMTTFEIRHN